MQTASEIAGCLPAADLWFTRRRRWVLALMLSLAVGLRLTYFVQLDGTAPMSQHLWPESDMNFFEQWAGEVAAGDLLSDQVLHPYHRWHRGVAALYLSRNPEVAAEYEQLAAARGDGWTAGELLWQRWFGGKQFHQEPLYPYLIALTASIFGPDVRWVFGWQMLVGVGTVMLCYLLSRRLFGESVGVLAGFLTVFYTPQLFYELVLLRSTLLTGFGVALAYVTLIAVDRRQLKCWAGLGVLCGLAYTLKTTFAIFLFGLLAYQFLAVRRTPRLALSSAGALVVGFVLATAPCLARNVAVGAPVMSLTSVGPLTFAASNGSRAEASVAGFSADYDDILDVMGSSEGDALPAMLATLAAHESPLDVLSLFGRRLANILHWYEAPQNVNFYYYALHAPVLHLRLAMWLLAPLALIGLVLAGRRWGQRWPLYLLVFGSLVPLVAVSTVSRFRVQLMVALIPFAALALAGLVRLGRRKSWPEVGACAAGALLLGLFVMRPLPRYAPIIRATDYIQPYNYFHAPVVTTSMEQQRWGVAIERLRIALSLEPPEMAVLQAERPPESSDEAELARHFAGLHALLARCLEQVGDEQGAARARKRGEALAASLGSPG